MRTASLISLLCFASSACQSPRGPAATTAAAPAVPVSPPAAAPVAATEAAPAEPVPLGQLPRDARPTHETIALTIDPAADRFGGTAEIALHLDQPRAQIWLHGRGLTVSSATLTPSGAAAMPARWEEVDPTGVVRVTLARPVAGDAVLHVAFDAAYDPTLVGVYRVNTSAGPAVFSKFEAIYARRAFPCFDEPSFKVPFDVAITAPADANVIGNMPVASDAPAEAGKRRVQFATTPPLPSYLVAFAVGPFDSRSVQVPANPLRTGPLPLGSVAMRGRGADTAYALAEETELLAEQERYFGIKFPYPKLDLVAVPDFQSGAMENAGAITFRDSALLVNDKVTSLDERIGVTSVIAHETAHQWFGDLVTMPWWNDLWLNEGFATFLATKTLRAVRPKLEEELVAVYATDNVMNGDSLASARRIRQPIASTHDITNAFDGITYQKGAAVLRMVEHYLGDEPFRLGLHDYLTAHANGNATTDDLIDALSRSSGKELGAMVFSFLDQPGVPAVEMKVQCETGRARVDLSQSRWKPVGSSLTADRDWMIPVCIRAGIERRVDTKCVVLARQTASIQLSSCPDWIAPNADAAGYYRAMLGAAALSALADHRDKLTVAERVQAAFDLDAAYRSATIPGGDVLRVIKQFAADPHGAVALVPLGTIKSIRDFTVEGEARAQLTAWVSQLYAPLVAQLGWTTLPSDGAWRRLTRTRMLSTLALQIEDPAVLDEAARRGRQLLGLGRDHVRHPDAVGPDLASVALAAAARTGGADVFDALIAELGRSEDAQLRERVLRALGYTREPALITRALDLSLDPKLRKNERLATLGPLLGSLDTRDAAWAWIEAHFDELIPLLPDRFAGRVPAMLAMCDAQRAERVKAFFTPRVDKLTGAPRTLAQALEQSQQCVARVEAQRDSVSQFVAGLPRPPHMPHKP